MMIMRKEIILLLVGLVAILVNTAPVLADEVTVSASVSSYISAVFNYAAVSFGSLAQGSINNTATPTSTTGIYNVTVSSNDEWKVSASGTDFTDGGSNTFPIANLKMDSNATKTDLAVNSAVILSEAPQVIDTNYAAGTSVTNYNGYWLSIPANQYATAYSSTVTVTYANV
jgi:hypothetical protein